MNALNQKKKHSPPSLRPITLRHIGKVSILINAAVIMAAMIMSVTSTGWRATNDNGEAADI